MLYFFNAQMIPLNWQLADSYTVKIKRISVFCETKVTQGVSFTKK